MSLSLSKKRRHLEEQSSQSSSKRSRQNESSSSTTGGKERQQRHSQLEALPQSQLPLAEAMQRCGKIERIHLTNFMCHANLVIPFHQRVNFLVGSNGCGKSAILAALVLGLGAKTKVTNRFGSVKQLIKIGENSAKIEISLINEGPEAYEWEKYGDRIVVVRTISQSSSTYAIKNAQGQTVSKKVEDLNRILLYHNVQVDNPVFVLNQDSARQFLKDLNPKKNYQLFLKATQIELIEEKLNNCLHSRNDHKNRIKCYQEKLRKNKNEIEELKAKLEQLMSLETLKHKLQNCEIEYAWLLVKEQEDELVVQAEDIAQKEQSQQELLAIVQNKEQMENAIKQEINMLESSVQDKNIHYSTKNIEYQHAKNKLNDLNQKCLNINSHIGSYKNRKTDMEQKINDLQNHIEERSQDNVGDIAEIRRHNEAALVKLRATQAENSAMLENTRRDIKLFLDNKVQIEEQIRNIQQQKYEVDGNIRVLNAQIANIKSSSKNKLSLLGEHVPQLLSEIERLCKERKFSEPPRGPIARYIEVPNDKYRNVIENQIGSLLHAFIVSSSKDRHMLEMLLKQKFPTVKTPIITTRFMQNVYNVSNGSVAPPRGTRLLMNEIKCKDAVVMNCLIDRVQIETVLITESKDIAEHLTAHRENVPQCLQKVIVAPQGLEYYPDPHFRMYTIQIRAARYIQVNLKDRINQLELEIQERQNILEQLDNDMTKNLQPQQRNIMKRQQEKRALHEQHESKKRDLEEKISELENFEYPESNQIDILRKELVEHQERLERIVQKLNETKVTFSDAKSLKDASERELNEQENSMRAIQKEIDNIKNKAEDKRLRLRSLTDNFHQNHVKLKKIEETLNSLKKEKSIKIIALGKITYDAALKGERIESERSPDVVVAAIQKIKAKITHSAKIDEDPDKLRDLIEAKEHTLQKDECIFVNIKASIEFLGRSLKKRMDFIKKLKQHLVLLVQNYFNNLLKMRRFSGWIEVDHEEKTLQISVRSPNNHGTENVVVDTNALSGGERSYTTVAFLISLWSCVDHPFYFLDEYDVFTDEVNREYMTRLLVNEGQRRPHRQYTFLTPLDMELAAEDFIKIHKLAEPERR